MYVTTYLVLNIHYTPDFRSSSVSCLWHFDYFVCTLFIAIFLELFKQETEYKTLQTNK